MDCAVISKYGAKVRRRVVIIDFIWRNNMCVVVVLVWLGGGGGVDPVSLSFSIQFQLCGSNVAPGEKLPFWLELLSLLLG
jgi:hypothetical protein